MRLTLPIPASGIVPPELVEAEVEAALCAHLDRIGLRTAARLMGLAAHQSVHERGGRAGAYDAEELSALLAHDPAFRADLAARLLTVGVGRAMEAESEMRTAPRILSTEVARITQRWEDGSFSQKEWQETGEELTREVLPLVLHLIAHSRAKAQEGRHHG